MKSFLEHFEDSQKYIINKYKNQIIKVFKKISDNFFGLNKPTNLSEYDSNNEKHINWRIDLSKHRFEIRIFCYHNNPIITCSVLFWNLTDLTRATINNPVVSTDNTTKRFNFSLSAIETILYSSLVDEIKNNCPHLSKCDFKISKEIQEKIINSNPSLINKIPNLDPELKERYKNTSKASNAGFY